MSLDLVIDKKRNENNIFFDTGQHFPLLWSWYDLAFSYWKQDLENFPNKAKLKLYWIIIQQNRLGNSNISFISIYIIYLTLLIFFYSFCVFETLSYYVVLATLETELYEVRKLASCLQILPPLFPWVLGLMICLHSWQKFKPFFLIQSLSINAIILRLHKIRI